MLCIVCRSHVLPIWKIVRKIYMYICTLDLITNVHIKYVWCMCVCVGVGLCVCDQERGEDVRHGNSKWTTKWD